MGRNAHKRASSVPASNRDHKVQGLGYAKAVESSYVATKDLQRKRLQTSYPDVATWAEKKAELWMEDTGALTKFSKNGSLFNSEEDFICWVCSESMKRQGTW